MFKRPILIAAVVLAMAIAVIYRFAPYILKPHSNYENGERLTVTGEILRTERRTDRIRIFLKQAAAGTSGKIPLDPVRGHVVLLMSPEEYERLALRIGNRLSAECVCRAFRSARNYGNFEEEDYYTSLSIFLMAEAEHVTITDPHTDLLRQFLDDLRSCMVRSIYQAVQDPETAGILAAICTGDRSGITEETRMTYQSSGIIHILAVSGLHISLIGMSIFRLLRKRFRYPLSAVFSLWIMLGFCIMSSASPSAVRATIMFTVQIIGIGLGKQYDIICSLSLAAILMLLGNPLYLMNTAFQLSFAAVLGVGFLYPALGRFFLSARSTKTNKNREKLSGTANRFFGVERNQLKEKIASGLLMSLSVNLAVLPVVISAYYEISLYSVFLNLIVIPLMSVILGTGLVSSAFGMISVLGGRFFAGAGVFLVMLIRWVCGVTEILPASSLVVGALPPERIVLYYLLLILLTAGITLCARCRKTGFSASESLSRRMIAITISCILLLTVLLAGRGHSGLRMSFVDVGQGDGILIENPSGNIYLIDGGSSSVQQVAKYNLSGAVKYYGISNIDYAVITHPDEDHISGLMEILDQMGTSDSLHLSIRNILIPYVPENANYAELVEKSEEKGVQVLNLHAGMKISDRDLVITCLHPDPGYRSDSANGYSAVLDLRYGEFSALLTGDLESDGEEILLPFLTGNTASGSRYDLLKVAHHGSRFSSGQEFLEAVSPEIAVVSAGVNNLYGHPHEETLERLRSVGAKIYVTAWQGEIIVEADLMGNIKIDTKLHTGRQIDLYGTCRGYGNLNINLIKSEIKNKLLA